ncbi:MAG TPA: PAS domain-containing protein [Thermoanaerobaculia bacterium]|nr:PAS domain-containing protein [Thermoanaerobaculia bacterium]
MHRLLILALIFISFAALAQPAARSPREIRVVVDNDYAPYSFRSADGKLQGIVIDQWKAWEKKTGIKAEIQAMDWAQALRRMRAGEFDVIDCIVVTDKRREYFDFTPAYATVEASIFFRDNISGITGLASLRGFPVGVKAGDQHIDKLRESGVSTVIPFSNNGDIVKAAKQHKIDVFVADVPSALYLLQRIGVANDFRRSAPVFRDQLRRAVRKGDAKTLSIVSDGFAEIDPVELKRIDEEWFGYSSNWYEAYVLYAAYATAAALLLIAGLIGWNGTLRRRVLQRTAALEESEERFRQIAENTHEVFWLIAVDSNKTLYVSPAYEAVWGRSRESLYEDSQSFFATIHPEDRHRVAEVMMRDREHGFDLEYQVVRPGGSIRWIWDRGFPIRNQAGRVYRLAGIAEDITERKTAADVVRQGEDRIRLIIDTIPIMAWSLRPDGIVDFLNQRWLDYTGLTLEQYVKDPTGPIHPEDIPHVMENWFEVMASPRFYEQELRLQRADRKYRWFLVRTVPLLDEQGRIVKWYGTSTDIEDHKRAEEKLKRSESQLAEAQRISHVGHWERDIEGGEIICSEETYRIFGLPPQDAIRNLEQLIHPEDRPLHAQAMARALCGEVFDVEYRVVRPDGGIRIVHSQGSAIQDQSGRPRRTFGAVQDVTEIKRTEEMLKATSEQLRALSARIQSAREEEGIRIAREIHDELGATLTSLRWELEGIKKSLSEPERVLPRANLQQKLTTMFGLIDTMVNIVRGIASDLRPVVLDVLGLEEAIEWQAQQFQDRTGIAVDCHPPGEDADLSSEQSIAVFRIFQEALTNILRHAGATGVDVTMALEVDEYVLSVRDNGRGITESEKYGQLSIGLLGMRERAHLIGGEIDVSGVEGEGTTVTVRLPIVRACRTATD